MDCLKSQVDQGEEARRVFKTDDPERPGVEKLLERLQHT